MRVLCVLLPHFPLQCEAERRPSIKDCQALVMYAVGSQKLVLDYSAELEGLQAEMPLQEALSKYGESELIPADIPYYWSAFNRLQDALEEKCPLVEGAGLGCIYLGIDGLDWIYSSDTALVAAIRESVPAAFVFQTGIAEGKFPAYLAALSSPVDDHRIVTGGVESFLKDFSCDVLPISWQLKKRLCDFGLNTLGQVAALPPGPLQSQFGPEGKRIWELARGHDEDPFHPRYSEEVIEEGTELPSMAVSLEAILAAVDSLLARALLHESIRGRGIRSLTLWAQVQGLGYWERSVSFKDPATGSSQAISRIKHILQNSPIPGPVEDIGLKITGFCQERGRQSSLFSEVRAKEQLHEDIKQIELRLGKGPQVFQVRGVEPWSRIPERRQALTPSSQ
jgi:DNA polymerase-4